MTGSQPWWARPGGVPTGPGATPETPQVPGPQQGSAPGGQNPYWNPNPASPPPAQGNPYSGNGYGAPQQPYGQPNPATPSWQGGGYQQAPANPYQQQGYPDQAQYPYPQPGGAGPKAKSSSKGLLIGGLIVIAVLVVGGGIAAWMFMGGKQLDVKQAEAGVAKILTDPVNGYGSNDVSSVECNNGQNPKVAKDGSFTCKVEIGGKIRNVNVEFTDDEGTYAVDGPR